MSNMPYGDVKNWTLRNRKTVNQAEINHGYRHIVAWGVLLGSFAYYIEMQCARAKEQGAPKDAIYLSGTDFLPAPRVWKTHTMLWATNPRTAKRMDDYVAALVRLERDGKA